MLVDSLVGADPLGYLEWILPKLAATKSHEEIGLMPHDFASTKAPDPR